MGDAESATADDLADLVLHQPRPASTVPAICGERATTVAEGTSVVVSVSGLARVTVERRVVEGMRRPSSRASRFRTSADVATCEISVTDDR